MTTLITCSTAEDLEYRTAFQGLPPGAQMLVALVMSLHRRNQSGLADSLQMIVDALGEAEYSEDRAELLKDLEARISEIREKEVRLDGEY